MSGAVPVEQGGTGRTDGKAVGLATPHNIKLTGEVSGSASFDGTADCTITAKIEASHIQAADAAPSDQKRFWIDTANEKILKYHDGTSWVPVHAVWAP